MIERLNALFEALSPLWGMSLTAAWAAGAVFLLRLVLKKRTSSRVICALWLVVFARLLIPVSLESPVSLVPARLSAPAVGIAANAPAQGNGNTVLPNIQLPAGSPSQDTNPVQAPEGIAPVVTAPVVTAPASPVAPVSHESPSAPETPQGRDEGIAPYTWQAVLAGVWMAGVLAMTGCGVATFIQTRRRVRLAVKVSVRVWEDENVISPFILGVFRPKIYLPSGLEPRARRFILCHEFAHLRRMDHIVKPLCWLALALHWFNPAVWAAFLLMSRDMEAACDEAVLRSLGEGVKADYSYTLLSLATGGRVPVPSPLSFDEGDAKGRIKNVLSYRRPALWIVVVSVLAVAVAAVCLLTNPVAAEEPADSPSEPSQSEPGAGHDEGSAPNEGGDSPETVRNYNDQLDTWMLEVLRGERTFSVNGTERDIDHLTQMVYGDEPPENVDVYLHKLAILDLDQDGAKELVIWPTGQRGEPYEVIYYTGYLMLRQEGDTIRGYAPGWRSSGGLKADGIFRWSSSALNNGIGRARFENGEFSVEPIAWCEPTDPPGTELYFVEGLYDAPSVEGKVFEGYIASHDAWPDPFWYTFESGELCASISIPLNDFIQWSENIPYFLDEDQQMLYRQALSLYCHIFGANTEEIETWPGPVDLPHGEPIELYGHYYEPVTGLFAYWDDFEAAVLSVFTEEFWNARNRWGGDAPTYTNVNGRTYYSRGARGSYGYNDNFPETFHLMHNTETEISFVMTGHYSENHPLEGESYEERDIRLQTNWEEYIGFPMKLVLTENGWRFDEFHSAMTDNGVLPYCNQAVPNPDLDPDARPAGVCVHGLDNVFIDRLIDGRLVFRCEEDWFPYYPPYPCAYNSSDRWSGDCDGDGHMEHLVQNSAGVLMLCDVVDAEMNAVTYVPHGEMKTTIFDPRDMIRDFNQNLTYQYTDSGDTLTLTLSYQGQTIQETFTGVERTTLLSMEADAAPKADGASDNYGGYIWFENGNELRLYSTIRPTGVTEPLMGAAEWTLQYDGESLSLAPNGFKLVNVAG